MKKLLLLLICFFPLFVNAADSNRYYGYYQTIKYPDSTDIMLSYYNNGWIDDDEQSTLQMLSANSSRNHRYMLSTYGVCHSGTTTCIYNNLDIYDTRFFEQDLCVSTNKISFEVQNGSSQDFATNKHPHTVVLDKKCDLYTGSKPDNVVGPAYWEWLDDYEGYVVKVFLPIAHWKNATGTSGSYYEAISRFIVHNKSNHEIYYRFLTTGGLYDHSRWFEIGNNFDIDTKNFDLTYDAVEDGMNVYDNNTHTYYQPSKNKLNINLLVGRGLSYSNGVYTLDGTSDRFSNLAQNVSIPKGTYHFSYDVLGGNTNRLNIVAYCGNTPFYLDSNNNIITDCTITRYQIYVPNNTSIIQFSDLQFEPGTYKTDYCPFGVTLDNNCVSTYKELVTWSNDNLFDNIWSILQMPFKLSVYVIQGCSGNCSPLAFRLFNKIINVPCGSFFWNRDDVHDFRIIWNLLFGGFIIFRLLLWNIRVITSVLDPTQDAVGLGVDLIDYSGRREIREARLNKIRGDK